MTTPNRIHLCLDGRSYTVAVDGRDVSEHVAAVDLHAAPHDVPHVVLHLHPTESWPAELDLLARVKIGTPPDPPHTPKTSGTSRARPSTRPIEVSP
ncbi:hypothetical protein [Micromonospora sp. NPDC002575]|uniref:hypothetical protein n=1 Tax=Micromonospora sp. NPDC002575 TaxID=3364222 RepID=UPI003673AED3